ncbi:MAG: hypothetical protein KC561_02550 [Myxococcales bacterium]|nr:hypothetical protein [Myxococcales bacterium]
MVDNAGRHESYGITPVHSYVAPGPVVVESRTEGGRRLTRNVNAVVGVRLEVDLGNISPDAGGSDSGGVNPYVAGGWTSIGLGIASLSVATVMWINAADNEERHASIIADIGTRELTAEETTFVNDRTAENQAVVGNILMGVGAAAVVTGVVLLLLDPTGEEADSNALGAAPMFFQGGGGISWSATF